MIVLNKFAGQPKFLKLVLPERLNNIELINAQDELAKATDNQISALYRLNQSRVDLARATGQLEQTFAR